MEHHWVLTEASEKGFYCTHCFCFVKYNSTRVLQGCKGNVDNDTLRPPENERIKRALGHELMDYDWSDK